MGKYVRLLQKELDRLQGEEAHGNQKPSSNFVVRFTPEGSNISALEVTFDNELDEKDLAAGVTSDRVSRFTTPYAERAGIADSVFR